MYIKDLVEMDLFPEPFPVRIDHNTTEVFQYPAHWHKANEFVIALKKNSTIIINNERFLLDEGDMVLIAGGDIHSYPLAKDGERVFILFDLENMIHSELLREDYFLISKTVFIRKSQNKLLHAEVMKHIQQLLEEASNIRAGSRFILLARVYDLTALILRNSSNTEELQGSERKDLLYKIGQVVEYIEQNYTEPISLKTAARHIGFSEHYLSRVFSRAIGSPFHLYLNKVRIKHAESRIILNKERISEVAFSCGFNSLPTFNRLFREIKGCTPVQYRKMRWDHNLRIKEEPTDGK